MDPQEYPILTKGALREHDDALVDKVLQVLYWKQMLIPERACLQDNGHIQCEALDPHDRNCEMCVIDYFKRAIAEQLNKEEEDE